MQLSLEKIVWSPFKGTKAFTSCGSLTNNSNSSSSDLCLFYVWLKSPVIHSTCNLEILIWYDLLFFFNVILFKFIKISSVI